MQKTVLILTIGSRSMDNVIITPHSSGRTPRYMEHLFPIFHENLERFLAGKPLTNVVDLEAGY
jgi:phosphoglycerate dehydrogenase-like enzyme